MRDNTKNSKNLYRLDDEGLAGLPNYNFIRMFMSYSAKKNILPEVAFQNGLSIVEGITLKRVGARTKSMYGEFYNKVLFLNQFNIVIARSGSGKTVDHEDGKDVLTNIMGHNIFAPCTSPETLKKSLADSWTVTHLRKPDKDKKSKKSSVSKI